VKELEEAEVVEVVDVVDVIMYCVGATLAVARKFMPARDLYQGNRKGCPYVLTNC